MRKTSPKSRKGVITRKWCELRQKISVLQRQRRLQMSRVRNIGRVLELSGVAFRLVPPYGRMGRWFQPPNWTSTMDIQTDPLDSRSWYDVIICFWSDANRIRIRALSAKIVAWLFMCTALTKVANLMSSLLASCSMFLNVGRNLDENCFAVVKWGA